MNYGEKIAFLRKSKGMTQEELGKVLSVTYQAVSKWERGESLPDFSTMSQIAKYFGVPLDYFEDGTDIEVKRGDDGKEAAGAEIIGMCTVCGRALKSDDEYSDSPRIVCKSCKDAQDKENARRTEAEAEMQKAEAADRRRRAEAHVKEERGSGIDVKLIICSVIALVAYIALTIVCFIDKEDPVEMLATILALAPLAAFAVPYVIIDFINELRDRDDGPEGYTRNLSLIVGGIFAVLNIVLFLVLYFALSQNGFFFITMAIGVVVSFTFISQYMWGSVVREIFTCGGLTFKLPGVIFSLTPESIVLMIVIKIVLGLLSVVIFIATTVLFAVVAMLGSVFTFIPCILAKTVKDRKVAKEYGV